MEPVFDAILFAAEAHSGQYRKGTQIPFILHPLSVARILIELRAEENLIVAAVLHDTVEDTDVTLADIQQRFGDRVAEYVAAVSESDRTQPWEVRKKQLLASLETASEAVLMLDCADKLDNIRSIRHDLEREGEAVWDRFNKGRDSQQWYYQSLVSLLQRRMTGELTRGLLSELANEVACVFDKADG